MAPPTARSTLEPAQRVALLALVILGVPAAALLLLGTPGLAPPSDWSAAQAYIEEGHYPSGAVINAVSAVFLLGWIGSVWLVVSSVLKRADDAYSAEVVPAADDDIEFVDEIDDLELLGTTTEGGDQLSPMTPSSQLAEGAYPVDDADTAPEDTHTTDTAPEDTGFFDEVSSGPLQATVSAKPPHHPSDAEMIGDSFSASADEPPMIVPVRAYYFTRPEDTLRSISAQFLQTPTRWEQLRALNVASPGVADAGPDSVLASGAALALPGDPLPWGKPDPVYLWTLAEKFLFTAWGREPTPEEVVPFWRGLTGGAQIDAGEFARSEHLTAPEFGARALAAPYPDDDAPAAPDHLAPHIPQPEPVSYETLEVPPEPEPVSYEAPEPEPVSYEAPEPEPVSYEAPEPEPVSYEAPEPEPVSYEAPEPEPVSYEAPEPEPVSYEAPEVPPGPEYGVGTFEPETPSVEVEAPRMSTFMPSLMGADPAAPAAEAGVVESSRRSLAGTAVGDAMMLLQLSRIRRRSGRRTAADPVEESLSQSARVDTLNLIEAAMRHLRAVTVGKLREKPAVLAVRVGSYGFEALLSRPVEAPQGWRTASMGHVLELPRGTTIEDLGAAGHGPTLCPALVPVGDTVEGPLLLNIEEIRCLIVSGPTSPSVKLLNAVVGTLGASPLAGDIRIITVGLDIPSGAAGWAKVHSTTFDSPELEDLLTTAQAGSSSSLDILIVGPGNDLLIQRAGQAAETPGSRLAVVGSTSSLATRWPWRIHVDETTTAVVHPIACTMAAAQMAAPSMTRLLDGATDAALVAPPRL